MIEIKTSRNGIEYSFNLNEFQNMTRQFRFNLTPLKKKVNLVKFRRIKLHYIPIHPRPLIMSFIIDMGLDIPSQMFPMVYYGSCVNFSAFSFTRSSEEIEYTHPIVH